MIRKIIDKVKYFFSNDNCYNNMVLQGIACNDKCKGVAGGTWETGFLNESCVSCKYYKCNVKHSGKQYE